jgi:hypothetical protein
MTTRGKSSAGNAAKVVTAAGANDTANAIAEIRPGQSIALLKELHILTREGKLNQDSRRKLKQVYHLYQFIEKLLLPLAADGRVITLADHGAGKSYLGFIIYDLFFKNQRPGHIYGIEARQTLVEQSRMLAEQLDFEGMTFVAASVEEATRSAVLPATIDVVTALHACDTATDDAIAFGLGRHAKFMVLVPCCQAEVSRALNADKARSLSRTPLAELWRHPLHTREIGSQLTNVLRCLYLEACGYQVTVTELVGWEHSMKNELIIATYIGNGAGSSGKSKAAAARMHALAEEFGLQALLPIRFPKLL